MAYAPITRVIEKETGFLRSRDFKPKRSDRIIIGLAESIEKYWRGHGGVSVKYNYTQFLVLEKRIESAEIHSIGGGVVHGTIKYVCPSTRMPNDYAKIEVRIEVGDSVNETVYNGLVAIVKQKQ